MVNLTISLPEAAKDWIEEQARDGGYASVGAYFGELVMRERIRQGEELSLEEVQQLVKASRESGISSRSVDEIFAEAEEIVAARKAKRA